MITTVVRPRFLFEAVQLACRDQFYLSNNFNTAEKLEVHNGIIEILIGFIA
jgi:hypothetical protein